MNTTVSLNSNDCAFTLIEEAGGCRTIKQFKTMDDYIRYQDYHDVGVETNELTSRSNTARDREYVPDLLFGEWLSMEDDIPNVNERVDVRLLDGRRIVDCVYEQHRDQWLDSDDSAIKVEVVRWARIPEHPKQ